MLSKKLSTSTRCGRKSWCDGVTLSGLDGSLLPFCHERGARALQLPTLAKISGMCDKSALYVHHKSVTCFLHARKLKRSMEYHFARQVMHLQDVSFQLQRAAACHDSHPWPGLLLVFAVGSRRFRNNLQP